MEFAEVIQRELRHPKIFLSRYRQEVEYHTHSQLPLKVRGLVPGYKHLIDEATITMKLEEGLVASCP